MIPGSETPARKYGILEGFVESLKKYDPETYARLSSHQLSVCVMHAGLYDEGAKSTFVVNWGGVSAHGRSTLEKGELEREMERDRFRLASQGIHVVVEGKDDRVHAMRTPRM
jgi:hypothetical protein